MNIWSNSIENVIAPPDFKGCSSIVSSGFFISCRIVHFITLKFLFFIWNLALEKSLVLLLHYQMVYRGLEQDCEGESELIMAKICD
jgi:hypothetical protein